MVDLRAAEVASAGSYDKEAVLPYSDKDEVAVLGSKQQSQVISGEPLSGASSISDVSSSSSGRISSFLSSLIAAISLLAAFDLNWRHSVMDYDCNGL